MFKKEMNTEIYESVVGLACELVNSSSAGETKEYWGLYNKLENICSSNEGTKFDHSFQWETLADFTMDDPKSILIYEKAFKLAKNAHLNEYMASIKFAMAERFIYLDMNEMAYSNAEQANKYAKEIDDLDLRKEISEFLLNESNKI